MIYYQLIDGIPVPAKLPLRVIENGVVREIYNPTQEEWANAGCYQKVETEPPTYDSSYQDLSKSYKIVDGVIRSSYRRNTRDVEEVRAEKLSEINRACDETIYSGVDVETSAGTEHFSFTIADQIDIKNLCDEIKDGAEYVPYHADGKRCRLYTAAEMIAIDRATKAWRLYQLTYCNHLRDYVKSLTSAKDIAAVTYGMALPDELQNSLGSIIEAMASRLGGGDE